MKRFLRFVLGLMAVTCLMMAVNEVVNLWLCFTASNTNAYKMYRLIAERPEHELAIIGSSRAEAGFAPLEIAPYAFNYGISGASMRETIFHLRCLMERGGNDPIVINLDPWGLGGTESFIGNYRLVALSPLVKSESGKIKLQIADYLPGLRFHGKFRPNFAAYMNNRLAITKTMEEGAILQRLSRNKEEWEYLISTFKPALFNCDEETEELLIELLTKNDGRELVFVVSPVSPPWWKCFEGKAELAELKTQLSAYPHVHVLDYTGEEFGFDLPEFMDLTHLNETGARRFSRLLKGKLQELGLI